MGLRTSIMSQTVLAPVHLLPPPTVWLSADTGVTISDTDRVDSWASKVNATHAFANTGNNRPTYTASGIGSKPSLVFNIAEVRSLTYAAKLFTSSVGTIVAVSTFADVTAQQVVFGQSDNTSDEKLSYTGRRSSSAPAYRLIHISITPTANLGYSGTSQLAGATPYVIRHVKRSASVSSMAINGTAAAGGTTDGSALWLGGISTANCCTVGGCKRLSDVASPHGGQIAEILVYDRALSERQCRIVEKYLGAKYGIAIAF